MPTALITGASSGIGRELARVFAREKYDLVLVARSANKLQDLASELKPAKVRIIAKDLTLAASPGEIFAEVSKVDVLVNNAGYTVFGKFAETPLADELNMIQLNIVSVVALTKLYLPGMVQARGGRVMNVASTAAFQPGPLMAIYYATKAFVLSFSEAISNELRGTGVTVTALCPGPTESGFAERGQVEDSGLFKGRKLMTSKEVAEIGYRALMEGRSTVIAGLKNRVMAESTRFIPRSVAAEIARKMQDRVH